MKLLFCYVDSFRNIEQQGFNFSLDYECSYEHNIIKIQRKELSDAEILLTDPITRNLSVIVGKTGSGKTNLLQLIGMSEDMRHKISDESRYFLLYEVDRESDEFAIETNRMWPKGLATGKSVSSPALVYFKYADSKICSPHVKRSHEDPRTVIINSFDKGAFNNIDYDLGHIDGAYAISPIINRFIFPYERTSAGIACWYAREYISQFPEDCIKRNAAFEIQSRNWGDEMPNDLADDLLESEYWFYYDNWDDKSFKSVRDVPKFFNRNVRKDESLSLKQKFIHDLMTDYALYLRKWADVITPLSSKKINTRRYMGYIRDLGIKDCHELPDGKCIDDLRLRIRWLCQYIDLHTDEMNGNKGLMYQIADDIVSLADIFYSFDDSYFLNGRFTCFIDDIEFEERCFNELFERMSRYRADQLGAFRKELLPFNITYLSSGEYQYARVLGSISEFTSHGFMQSQEKVAPTNIILLLDEPETFMHPDMCRKFIYWMGRILHERNKLQDVQVIMSTHSPFILSDLLPKQIIRITFDKEGMCKVVNGQGRPTFADDIHSIMANEFFLDYSIGELSKHKLEVIMDIINKIGEKPEKDKDDIIRLHLLLEVIPHIGDELIRTVLSHMIKERLA